MTTKEAADYLGVTPGRIRQLVLEGRLPAEKIGRDLHLKEKDLKAFKKTMKPAGRPAKKEVVE